VISEHLKLSLRYACLRDNVQRKYMPSNRGGMLANYSKNRHYIVLRKRNLGSNIFEHIVTHNDLRTVTHNVKCRAPNNDYLSLKKKTSVCHSKRYSAKLVLSTSNRSGFSSRTWVWQKIPLLPYRSIVHCGVHDNNWRHVATQLGARAHYFLQVDDRHGDKQSNCSRSILKFESTTERRQTLSQTLFRQYIAV